MSAKHWVSKVAIVLFAATVLRAQGATEQSNSNKAKEMLDRTLAALGGQKYATLKNQVASGRIYAFFREQLSGLDVAKIVTEYEDPKPAKGLAVRVRQFLGKKEDYGYLFLPDQAWEVTYRGARPIPDDAWERYERATFNDILYILRARYDEPGLQFDYVGTDVLFSTHVEIVDITDAKDQVIRVYLDHNTMLPIRETFSWFNPETKEHNDEAYQYDKYRDVGDGVMLPYVIERERNGYRTFQMFGREIQVNQPVPANTFELPAGAKMLRKVN